MDNLACPVKCGVQHHILYSEAKLKKVGVNFSRLDLSLPVHGSTPFGRSQSAAAAMRYHVQRRSTA
jgi:hypothetical protein